MTLADPGAHFSLKDLRCMSSTLAWLRGAKFDEIRGSCYWHSFNTFVQSYFKPPLIEDVPLVALGTLRM